MKTGNYRRKKSHIKLPIRKVFLLAGSILIVGAFMVMTTVFVSIKKNTVQEIASDTNIDNVSTSSIEQKVEIPVQKQSQPSSILVSGTKEESPKKDTPKSQPTTIPPVTKPVPVVPPKTEPINKGTLIFVFDDGGQNLSHLQPFLELPFPVTIAVLPSLSHSVESANRIRKAGKELILHQPMQAKNLAVNPGPSSIQPDMSLDNVREIVLKNISEIGPISGMNNHEGSLITESLPIMETVLQICKENNIYFLDSRTTSDSKAAVAADKLNLKIWERKVFLDNTQNKNDILSEVERGLNIASKNGHAIMIGHVWSNDLANILTELYPELVSQGYSFSTISNLINGTR